jgi:hypothetical protein
VLVAKPSSVLVVGRPDAQINFLLARRGFRDSSTSCPPCKAAPSPYTVLDSKASSISGEPISLPPCAYPTDSPVVHLALLAFPRRI